MSKLNQAVDYDHSKNLHSLAGPQAALPILFADLAPVSLLDVGCGTGTWLRAAMDFGTADVVGIDGADIPPGELLVPAACVKSQDLTQPWNLGRRFDTLICVEVAEHLDQQFAPTLIDCLTRHSDTIYFSAACPGQDGQHHVNCQWPGYWQKLFNDCGFVCSDEIRWRIWDASDIEPWYRQNLFQATRDATRAGNETRIKPVIHPEMVSSIFELERFGTHVGQIENGIMRTSWYARALVSAVANKVKRRTSRARM